MEISTYYPNGHQVFIGKVTRTSNNDGADNTIQLTVLSYGADLANYLIEGSESLDSHNTVTDGSIYGVYNGVIPSQPFYKLGQTFKTGPVTTALSAISITAAVSSSISNSISSVGVDIYTAPEGHTWAVPISSP